MASRLIEQLPALWNERFLLWHSTEPHAAKPLNGKRVLAIVVKNIAEENFVAADESLDSVQETVSLLATQPEMGRARPELADGLRSFPTRTPYIIFYVPDEDGLLVVRVLHHARDIDAE